MAKRKTMQKYVEKTTEGRCPYCSKAVKSLEAHIKAKHKYDRFTKKQLK